MADFEQILEQLVKATVAEAEAAVGTEAAAPAKMSIDELEALRAVAEAARAHTSGDPPRRGDTIELVHALERLDMLQGKLPVRCNLCGEPCGHVVSSGALYEMGLIRCTVSGGFESTALDDGATYTFSLCEFCLDWLFTQMRTPPVVGSYVGGDGEPPGPFRPAAARVREVRKKAFFDESLRRQALRAEGKAMNGLFDLGVAVWVFDSQDSYSWPGVICGMSYGNDGSVRYSVSHAFDGTTKLVEPGGRRITLRSEIGSKVRNEK